MYPTGTATQIKWPEWMYLYREASLCFCCWYQGRHLLPEESSHSPGVVLEPRASEASVPEACVCPHTRHDLHMHTLNQSAHARAQSCQDYCRWPITTSTTKHSNTRATQPVQQVHGFVFWKFLRKMLQNSPVALQALLCNTDLVWTASPLWPFSSASTQSVCPQWAASWRAVQSSAPHADASSLTRRTSPLLTAEITLEGQDHEERDGHRVHKQLAMWWGRPGLVVT